LDDHKEKIRAVLSECDFMSSECKRDVALAQSLGLKGEVVSSGTSITGGIGPSEIAIADSAEVPAKRKIIMLKGYQHWAGRALSGLRALERCVEMLNGYEIVVHSAVPDVALAAKLFETNTGIKVRVLSERVAHSEILSLHAQARVSIGLSISDGISVSMLDAMAMGAFPIQSCTACADEWIEHGVSGMIVPPEDPDIIEMAMRTALSDDDLINRAAAINRRTVEDRLNFDHLKQEANEVYKKIIRL
jgi:glycosyltransferase involved in cell wall biosynthesis